MVAQPRPSLQAMQLGCALTCRLQGHLKTLDARTPWKRKGSRAACCIMTAHSNFYVKENFDGYCEEGWNVGGLTFRFIHSRDAWFCPLLAHTCANA